MKKLLVIDDEKEICNFVSGFFNKRGFEVVCATDSRDTLALIDKEKPTITILDVRMPYMDGIETLRRIREKHPSLAVIMVTSVDDAHTVDEAKRLGAIDYITKPLLLDELIHKVKALADTLEG